MKNHGKHGFTQGRTQRVVFAQYEQKRKELHSRLGPRKKEAAIVGALKCSEPNKYQQFFFQLEWKKMEISLLLNTSQSSRMINDFFSFPYQLNLVPLLTKEWIAVTITLANCTKKVVRVPFRKSSWQHQAPDLKTDLCRLVDRETRLPCNNCEEQHLLLALDVSYWTSSFRNRFFFWGGRECSGNHDFSCHCNTHSCDIHTVDTTSGVVCGTSAWGSCELGRAVKFHLDWSESSGCKCIPPPLPKRLFMGRKILASKLIWYKDIYI